MIRLYRRFLSLVDALAAEPVWTRSFVAYLAMSAFLWTAAALSHAEHGIVMAMRLPIAVAVPFVVVTYAVASVIREILSTPAYFVALAGILLVVSRCTPGESVSFRQLFSVTVHAGYILLAGHALRVAFALGGVELGGPAATLLPDPDAMFLPGPAEPVPAGSHYTSLWWLPGSPADIPAVGVFDTAFHALLGVAYCHIRGRRLIAGAAWGAGLSLLVDVVWLLAAGN